MSRIQAFQKQLAYLMAAIGATPTIVGGARPLGEVYAHIMGPLSVDEFYLTLEIAKRMGVLTASDTLLHLTAKGEALLLAVVEALEETP